jgi:hypothetical protein
MHLHGNFGQDGQDYCAVLDQLALSGDHVWEYTLSHNRDLRNEALGGNERRDDDAVLVFAIGFVDEPEGVEVGGVEKRLSVRLFRCALPGLRLINKCPYVGFRNASDLVPTPASFFSQVFGLGGKDWELGAGRRARRLSESAFPNEVVEGGAQVMNTVPGEEAPSSEIGMTREVNAKAVLRQLRVVVSGKRTGLLLPGADLRAQLPQVLLCPVELRERTVQQSHELTSS